LHSLQISSPKAAYFEATQSVHEVKASLGTLPGSQEEQLEDPIVLVILPSGQFKQADTPPML